MYKQAITALALLAGAFFYSRFCYDLGANHARQSAEKSALIQAKQSLEQNNIALNAQQQEFKKIAANYAQTIAQQKRQLQSVEARLYELIKNNNNPACSLSNSGLQLFNELIEAANKPAAPAANRSERATALPADTFNQQRRATGAAAANDVADK